MILDQESELSQLIRGVLIHSQLSVLNLGAKSSTFKKLEMIK